MYKEDLALNNLQWLICHKTKPNQTLGGVVENFLLTPGYISPVPESRYQMSMRNTNAFHFVDVVCLVLRHINNWVILCQSQFNNYDLQLWKVQNVAIFYPHICIPIPTLTY